MKILRDRTLFTVFGVLLGLAAAAIVNMLSAPPRGTPVMLQPAPTLAPILVDVSGAVRQPGIYALPANSRVQEAIQAAGGLDDSANRAAINLAAAVKDGEKLVVPEAGTPGAPIAPLPTSEVSTSRSGSIDITTPENSGPVNLNTATIELLQTLPGIGPTKAADIIAYREAHSSFNTVEELMDVKGIGPATFEKLKSLITVE